MTDFEPRERGNAGAQFLRMGNAAEEHDEDPADRDACFTESAAVRTLLTARLLHGKAALEIRAKLPVLPAVAPREKPQEGARVVPDLTALIAARKLAVAKTVGEGSGVVIDMGVFTKNAVHMLGSSHHRPIRPRVAKTAGGAGAADKTAAVPLENRKTMSPSAIEKRRAYAERTHRIRLLALADEMAEELSAMRLKVPSLADERLVALQLLTLVDEAFAQPDLENDHLFFAEVFKMLAPLWPKNYRRVLNDDRIQEMMAHIRMPSSLGEILDLLQRWRKHPLH